jgi:hypothetical protein
MWYVDGGSSDQRSIFSPILRVSSVSTDASPSEKRDWARRDDEADRRRLGGVLVAVCKLVPQKVIQPIDALFVERVVPIFGGKVDAGCRSHHVDVDR